MHVVRCEYVRTMPSIILPSVYVQTLTVCDAGRRVSECAVRRGCATGRYEETRLSVRGLARSLAGSTFQQSVSRPEVSVRWRLRR